jgi:P-type conjugative transfer protein TrbJ
MKLVLRRCWLGALGTFGALAIFSRPAAAWFPIVIPVEDVTRFVQMIEQLRQAANLVTQLERGVSALQNASQRLTDLPQSPEEALRYYRDLSSDLNTIGYRIDTITRQYHRIFPDEAAIKNTSAKDARDMSESWDREIYLSSLAAHRSQSSLKSIEGNTRTTAQLLERSNGSSSAVAQLQALVRMIGVINSDLELLSVTIAATERVNSSLAAHDASSRDVVAERRRRLLEDYARPAPQEGISPDFLAD